MRAKEYLMQIWNVDKDIQSRISERQSILQTQIAGIDYSKENVQETQKIFDDKYMKYLELREEIDAKIDKLIDLKRVISNQIDLMDDKVLMIILRERYLNMKSWSQIQYFMGYRDSRYLQRLHNDALKAFEKILSQKATVFSPKQ